MIRVVPDKHRAVAPAPRTLCFNHHQHHVPPLRQYHAGQQHGRRREIPHVAGPIRRRMGETPRDDRRPLQAVPP